jgi:LacI family transcriptional regulator
MNTIKDVAKKAHTSITTVSRVLNNSPHSVNPKTREKVLKAVRELNYRPNILARGLVMKESRTIGVIVPDISNSYYSEITHGIENIANQNGYTVIICNTNRLASKALSYIKVLEERQVDGIIFAGGTDAKKLLESELKKQKTKVILIGNHGIDFPSVQIDNADGACRAISYLIDQGHRNIGFIKGPPKSITSRERFQGYKKAMKDNRLPVKEKLIVSGNFTSQSGYEATRLLLRPKTKPTAIFCANDQMAIGSIKAIRESGYLIPDNISVIGFDDIELASYIRPSLTTVSVPMYQLGQTAMSGLLNIIQEKGVEKKVTLQTKLIIRESSSNGLKK